MLDALAKKQGAKIPTSSPGRIGRMALTALKSGKMVLQAHKHGEADGEIDAEKLVKLITSVGQLKGIAMKMGQIMSYIDVALPPELQEALSVLQTYAQPMPFNRVSEIVRTDLGGRADVLLRNMVQTPISAASIGQVHRAVVDGAAVAVKVQYPEVKKAIESDFGPASVGTRMASLFYPNARVDDYVKEARTRFLEECDYIHEAHCQDAFRRLFEAHPVLSIPAVFPAYCGTHVLTTAFVDGVTFDAFLETAPSQETRNRLGEALFEFYIGSLFRNHMYNCDPHPGNYLFQKDGTIAMLDHGCTRQFDPEFVGKLAYLTQAVHSDRREQIHQALLRLQIVRPEKSYDYEMIRGFLRSFYGPMLKDETAPVDLSSAIEMKEMFKKKQQLLKFTLPGEFTFLFRIRFGLMSVLARLGTEANWYQLERQYIDEFKQKYPILLSE